MTTFRKYASPDALIIHEVIDKPISYPDLGNILMHYDTAVKNRVFFFFIEIRVFGNQYAT